MTLSVPRPASKVNLLPGDVGSLSRGLPPALPDTLFVLGTNGGMSVAPDAEFPLMFGRNEPDVHVCVGAGDLHVSRQHGYIAREYSRWVINNIGRLPIRLPGARLILTGDRAELPFGYTPLFIVAPKQEHLLQVRVTAQAPPPSPENGDEAETYERTPWPLSPDEKLVLICLSLRYLRHEPQPQPLTWKQVADELNRVRPKEGWTWRKAAHRVSDVRTRLSPSVPGLLEKEIAPPAGNALNHNLITELLITSTLVKADLKLLGE
ncbi:hypothetical protein [Streptomyces sp. 150FB]|uniref:hypothetical protein n=1 Tax=Streptomyces sp. 150FB TaxID=1576605 RepID=UPI000A4720D2|nr:hypothetical protein [Streptomyces sp. 150FB]